MRVTIERDEWWPVYTLERGTLDWGTAVEMSQEDVEEIFRMQSELFEIYNKHQDKLDSIYRKEAVNATTN